MALGFCAFGFGGFSSSGVVRALGGLGLQSIRARPRISYRSNMSKAVITSGTSGKKGDSSRDFDRLKGARHWDLRNFCTDLAEQEGI